MALAWLVISREVTHPLRTTTASKEVPSSSGADKKISQQASTADVLKHRAFRDDTGLLDEGHVPSKVGHIGPTGLEGSDVDRQNYGARAGASSLAEEDLAPIASL